jgi:hypothetical protein
MMTHPYAQGGEKLHPACGLHRFPNTHADAADRRDGCRFRLKRAALPR